MAMEITNSYRSYIAQNMAGSSVTNSTKNKETEKTSETAGSSGSKGMEDYVRELAKLVPSVDLKVGNAFASAKNGKTLTINPKLLEEMKNNPEKEKEMKELIKGVESMTRLSESMNKASGWTTVFRHSYIDENGKYCHIALVRNDYMLNMSDELREERREKSEKLIEKTKEKVAKKKEELQEALEEKRTGEGEEKPVHSKAEQLLKEKIADSKDDIIYLYDTDFKAIMEAMKEDETDMVDTKKQVLAGANLDLKV